MTLSNVVAVCICIFFAVLAGYMVGQEMGDGRMARIVRDTLFCELFHYVIVVTREEQNCVEVVAEFSSFLAFCNQQIAERLSREHIGLTRLPNNYQVSFYKLEKLACTVPTAVIASSEYSVLSTPKVG